MQDKDPKSGNLSQSNKANTSKQETSPVVDQVEAPVKPEMTSKGVPVKVQNYEALTNALKKDQNEEVYTSEVENELKPEKQVSINGSIEGELSERPLVRAPIIKEEYQGAGKVVIKICVDQTGDVIYAKFTQRGSTTFNTQLKKLALDSVHHAMFEPSETNEQCGFVAFDFQ